MDVEKVKQWVDFTHSFQNSGFWPNSTKEKYSPEKFFKRHDKKEEAVVLQKETDYPKYDIYQDDTYIYVLVEVPGVDPKAVHISLQSKHLLIIKGTVQQPFITPESVIKKERFHGNFERTIQLPEPTEPQYIQLTTYLGLIQIIYPRLHEITPLHVP
jgi:HSP20 family protein